MTELRAAIPEDLARQLGLTDLCLLNRGGWGNGDVIAGMSSEGRVAIKTYWNRNAVQRALGRRLIARERAAYRTLAGLTGVPRLVGPPEPHALAVEFVEGENIARRLARPGGEVVVRRLRRLLVQMHECGVCHLDLRNQGNVLVDAADQPWLLDFASALHTSGFPGGLLGAPARRFDWYGLSKWEALAQP